MSLWSDSAAEKSLHSRTWNSSVHAIGIACTELDIGSLPSVVPLPYHALPLEIPGLGGILVKMTPHLDTLTPPIYNCVRTTTYSVDVSTFVPESYRDDLGTLLLLSSLQESVLKETVMSTRSLISRVSF